MEYPILTLINKPSRLVIGFMSGHIRRRGGRGVGAHHGCSRETKAEQLEFCFVPFEAPVRAEILRLAGGGAGNGRRLLPHELSAGKAVLRGRA